MPSRVAVSTLNASTIDILNTIRQNASLEYQNLVPKVTKATDIPKVGEVLFGYPAMANQFINALVSRIALVAVKSATFNNRFAFLKKGYLEYGETVEEIFVNIAKVQKFDVEKAEAQEFKRNIPDVRSAFHAINWKVKYPVTIEEETLRQAFLSLSGVQDMISRIVDSVYTAAEYDEYLLFKYVLIKAISHGHMSPVATKDLTDAAKKFRAMSNRLEFMSSAYNAAGVFNSTPRNRQVIFMDADFNAEFDVDVLAGAFNMDKTDFLGRLVLVDDWKTFDNTRWADIRAESDGLEEVTNAELAIMANVKAVLMDGDYFQFYDNLARFAEKYVASGLYWNYFYHTWKTISVSPFANTVVFVDSSQDISVPESITAEVTDKSISEEGTVITLTAKVDGATAVVGNVTFNTPQAAVENGIAVHKYGVVIWPKSAIAQSVTLTLTADGVEYTGTALEATAEVGSTITFTKAV